MLHPHDQILLTVRKCDWQTFKISCRKSGPMGESDIIYTIQIAYISTDNVYNGWYMGRVLSVF